MMNRRPLSAALATAITGHPVAVCAVEFEIAPGAREIQLMPAGHFKARDGRPGNDPDMKSDTWYIDGDIALRVIALAHARTTPFAIDYEHQTLTAKQSGKPAPAAGWFNRLEWREGDGLYAVDVEWTPTATRHIADKEYRFISPVFHHTTTGEVVSLQMAAITNVPGIDGMNEILAAATTYFHHDKPTEDTDMDLVKLRKMLGLPEDADETSIFSALSSVIDGKTTAETKVTELTTQLEQDQTPDPAKWVPIDTYNQVMTQVAALTTETREEKVTALVSEAIDNKVLFPAEREWATSLGMKDLATLKAQIDVRAPMAALTATQTQDKNLDDDNGKTQHSAEHLAVCSQFDLDPDKVA